MKKLPEIFRKKVEPNHINNKQVYYIDVIIKTNKKDYNTKIAGKVKNSLVTVDNEIIPIVEINDIIIKDRL